MTHLAIKLFWKSKSETAFWFRLKLSLMVFYSLWHLYEEFLKFLNLCKTQCLATNVLNQFHFWVDLYESLMQNKVKNYRVPHIRLQNSLLLNLFTGWEFYPPQFHKKKNLGMQMWYVSIERFLMATQKSSSSRLKGFCIVHTTCTLGSNYLWIWISRILIHLSFPGF